MELELPHDITEAAERVLPVDEWKSRYDPHNSDPLTWGEPRPQYAALNMSEAFHVYFKLLSIYPDVVVKDRLDGMDCIWNIDNTISHWSAPAGLMGDVSFLDIKPSYSSFMLKIRAVLQTMNNITTQKLKFIFWDCGLYVVMFFWGLMYFANTRKQIVIWAIAPSVFILITYVLVIAWQMYFYLWFFPLAVIWWLVCGGLYVESENV